VSGRRTSVFTRCAIAARMLATAQRLADDRLIQDALVLRQDLQADVVRNVVRMGFTAEMAGPAVASVLAALTSYWRDAREDYDVCPGTLFRVLLARDMVRRRRLHEADGWLRRQLASLN
jgi:hypothetical protein